MQMNAEKLGKNQEKCFKFKLNYKIHFNIFFGIFRNFLKIFLTSLVLNELK